MAQINKVFIFSTDSKLLNLVGDLKEEINFNIEIVSHFENIKNQNEELTIIDARNNFIEIFPKLTDGFFKENFPVAIIIGNINQSQEVELISRGAFDMILSENISKNTIKRALNFGFHYTKIQKRNRLLKTSFHERESNLRLIIDHVEDGILLIDNKYGIVEYNQQFIGMAKTVTPKVLNHFTHVYDFIEPVEFEQVWKKYVDDALSGIKQNIERVFKINGENFFFNVKIYPIIQRGMQLAFFAFSNITKLIDTQNEKELREANLKSLIENTYDPMWSINRDYKLIAFNNPYKDLASQYLGREPIIGDSVIFETYSDELASQWQKSYVRALNGERFEEEMVFNYAGGNIYIENEFNPIKNSDGEVIGVTAFSRDITEKRQSEETNKEFAAIVEFSNDAIISIAIDGIIRNWNLAATKTFGYKAYELIGQSIYHLFKPDDKPLVDDFLQKLSKGNAVEKVTSTLLTKNKDLVPVSLSFSPHTDGEGKVNRASAIIRDISDQIKAQKELMEQQHFIESIAETSPSILYVYDFYENKNLYINKRSTEILGYSKDEIKLFRRGIYDIVHPDDLHLLISRNRELLNAADGEIVESTYRVLHGTGKYIWLNARNTIFKRLPNGKVSQILGTLRDITHQKQSAQEIEMLSLFAKHTLNYVIISNSNRRIEYVNHAFEKEVGFTLNEVKGKTIEDLLKGPKTNKNALQEIIKAKEQKKSIEKEIIFYTKNRKPYWAATYINPVFDEFGSLKQYIQIQINITDRKKNEELTEQAKILAERNAKFKDEFLANMSHEIRTPLNGIIGMIDVLQTTQLNNEQSRYIHTLKNSSKSLLEIINNILDLSKLEAGKMELKPVVFNPTESFQTVIQLYSAIAHQKGIQLNLKSDKNINEFVKADENKIIQITSNLLSNALKFTEKGSVNLKISKLKSNILKIEVQDSGMGISPENQKVLFSKFTQLDQSSNKKIGGTGLGLAISKELTKLLGGEITLTSTLGKGSNFSFSFKFDKPTPDEVLKFEPQSTAQKNNTKFNKHILLVEDNATNREVAGLILDILGCTYQTAVNGIDALNVFKENTFDLVLMDIQMPIMDGVEATKKLKQKFKNLPPIVALSANAMEGDAEKYLNAGLDDYVPKPITIDALSKTLDKWFIQSKNQPLTNIPQIINETNETKTNQQQSLPILKEEIIKSLLNSGNEQMINQLFASFLNDAETLIGEILTYNSEKNLEELRKSNHTINGLSGTIGAMRLNKICIEISTEAKNQNFSAVNSLTKTLKHEFEELKKYINNRILKP